MTTAAIRRAFAALLFLGIHSYARAGFLMEGEGTYGLSKLKSSTESSATNAYGGFFAGASVGKKPAYVIGFRFNYLQQAFSSLDASSKSSFSAVEWGPQLGIVMGKSQSWYLDASYHPYVRGSVSENGTSLGNVSGWGYQASLAYAPQITESVRLGLKLVYHAANLSSLITPASAEEKVKFSSSEVMPVLFLSMLFGED
ncbi:MAG: hypothetical protein JST16_06250 [Bdellovibrionales bacterium]|nr:hypothetical protein [Bdellovibrionales bacterium]